jgi:hypothetical protein
MSTLQWSGALSLDLPVMDDTHREFVDLLAAVEAVPDDQLAAAWRTLIDHPDGCRQPAAGLAGGRDPRLCVCGLQCLSH